MPDRRFPADGVVLDACALVRMYKCETLSTMEGLTKLHVASQVSREFNKDPRQRKFLEKMKVIPHPMKVGTIAWDVFSQIWGGRFGNRDKGEAESLAICVAEARKGKLLPLVTFDKGAARKAEEFEVPTIDFLGLLSWLVARGSLTYEQADAIEALASQRNGWKRPPTYQGRLELHAEAIMQSTAHAIQEWRIRLRRSSGRKGSKK